MDCNGCSKINPDNIANICSEKNVKSVLDPEARRSQIPPPPNAFSPLSNPRGCDLKCEVCSKPAYLQCSACRVTYYWYLKNSTLQKL